MTVATDLATAVGSAYDPTEQAAAIVNAINIISGIKRETVAAGDDDSIDSAIVEIAKNTLLNKTLMEDAKVNNIVLTNVPDVVTPLARSLLADDEDTTVFFIGSSPPSKTWEGN